MSEQYGKKIGFGRWQGRLTGHTFDSEEAMVHFERLEALKLQARSQQQSEFDKLPADKVKLIAEGFLNAVAESAGKVAQGKDIDGFLKRHPEFVNSDFNGAKMNAFLIAKGKSGGAGNATSGDLEEAFDSLSAAGVLEINQERAAKNQPDSSNEEDSLYAMDGQEFFGLRTKLG